MEAFLINFVVEQTGYPAEVVDLDADLEADLGIDSIKKAQLFGELQEYFDISALASGAAAGGSLSLDDFTTLRHVLDFLVQSQSGAATAGIEQVLATTDPAPAVATLTQPAPVAAAHDAAPTSDVQSQPATIGDTSERAGELEAFLINFVVEQTGYPAEVVDLDADLEADLGIDSIKKAQLFGELQEYFDISALGAGGAGGGSLSLDDFTTLRHVLDFLLAASPASPAVARPTAAGEPLSTPDRSFRGERRFSSQAKRPSRNLPRRWNWSERRTISAGNTVGNSRRKFSACCDIMPIASAISSTNCRARRRVSPRSECSRPTNWTNFKDWPMPSRCRWATCWLISWR